MPLTDEEIGKVLVVVGVALIALAMTGAFVILLDALTR